MSGKDYGIESIADAFLALKDMKEEIEIPNAKRKGLKEAASVDVRSPEDVELAQDFRRNDKKEGDSELEVIDVDADSVENLQDGKSYIGKMLLQCNSCKATRFIDVDKLLADENDKDLYNVDDECPHCHNKGTGYALIGQVGKTEEENPEDEASLDNDANNGEEAMFDNTDEVEPEAEETSTEENTESNEESASDEETNYDETNAEDDTNDMELPELGDEFDVDDVMEDDTEDKDEEDKTKKESLNESYNQLSLDDNVELYADFIRYPSDYRDDISVKGTLRECLAQLVENGNYYITADDIRDNSLGDSGTSNVDDIINWLDDEDGCDWIVELKVKPQGSNEWITLLENGLPNDYDDDGFDDDKYDDDDFDESLDEKLDMSTFEGSIANLIDTFTIEDNPVNIKLLNKNGSELGMYGSDDLPFNVKSQMMDTFNTDDNYLEVNVTENGDGTTVNDLFNYYRPDENNQTTFVVTNVDTDEEEDFEDLTEFLEKYGNYYIDGALGLRTLNIYIADGDLETEVEPLDDEEIKELGKENAEKEEAEVTEESLIEEIIKSYPGLKLNRINNSLAEEYFIAESIKLNEDLDLVYKNFVKPTNNEKLIEHFKSYTGYEDEVDKFLKEHNISKEKYNKIINEEVKQEPENIKALKAAYDKGGNIVDDIEFELDNILGSDFKEKYNDLDAVDNTTWNKVFDNLKKKYTERANDGDRIPTEAYELFEIEEKQANEKLLTSVKDRAELGEAISKLVSANEKYHIKKSVNEGYRYDIFVNEDCKLTESKIPDVTYDEAKKYFGKDYIGIESLGDKHIGIIYHDSRLGDDDYENEQETEYSIDDEGHILNILDGTRLVEDITQDNLPNHLRDADYEEDHDYELDDLRARDEQGLNNDGPDTTEIVPDGMSPEEVEIIQTIERIADDISDAIQDTYHIEAPKNLIVADIVPDLQLVGGAKVVDELKNTPIDQVTKQMYLAFNSLFDEGVNSEDKLALALEMLYSDQFSTETIRSQIASPRFLQAAQAGYIPFINAAQLEAPVDESLNECDKVDINVDEFDECINEYLYSKDSEIDEAYSTTNVKQDGSLLVIEGIITRNDNTENITFTATPVLNESNEFQNKYIVTNNLNDKKFNLDL